MPSVVLCFDRKSWDVQINAKAGVSPIQFVVSLLVCLFRVVAVAIVLKSVFGAAVSLLGAQLGIIFLFSTLQQKDDSSEIFVNSTSEHHKFTVNISSMLWQSMGMLCLSLVTILSVSLMIGKNLVFGASFLIGYIPEYLWICWWIEKKFENSEVDDSVTDRRETESDNEVSIYSADCVSENQLDDDDDDWEDLSSVSYMEGHRKLS